MKRPLKISSLHDDLIWIKVAHECGFGDTLADGTKLPVTELSRVQRAALWGADTSCFDLTLMAGRGDGYEQYGAAMGAALRANFETAVAAIYDRWQVGEVVKTFGPPDDAEMERSVMEAARHHAHLGIPVVRGADDVADGGPNVVIGMEGMDFARNVAQTDALLDEGVRVFGLMYDKSNALADVDSGLTDLGRATVARVLSYPAAMDLAHSSPAVRGQILDFAEAEGRGRRVLYTHGATSADPAPEFLAKNPNRYLAEDEARRIFRLGGVVGVTPARMFFPSLAAVADRIDALCQLAGGAESVVLGMDFGGVGYPMMLPEIQSVHDVWRLADLLSERHGFSDAQVDGVLRTNATAWLRRALTP